MIKVTYVNQYNVDADVEATLDLEAFNKEYGTSLTTKDELENYMLKRNISLDDLEFFFVDETISFPLDGDRYDLIQEVSGFQFKGGGE